jgi:hypothetical protein
VSQAIKVSLFAPLLVFRAPGGIGARRVAASATPVPFAAIAEEYVHPQRLLDLQFNPVA